MTLRLAPECFRQEYPAVVLGSRPEADGPLPSQPSEGVLVGGIFGGLDHLLLKRPRPVTQIEVPYAEPWATLNGISVVGIDERVERPEPPDRTGARL
jgi:hypothetical protein